MATNKLQWKRIAKGDELPCQSFLRKKNGEILKLSTVAGVTVGQDAYYLPVDEVIEELRNYPIEESKDEMVCKKLIAFLKQCKAVYSDGFKQFGLDIDDTIAWLEKKAEPTDILANAVLDSNKDGLIADTIQSKPKFKVGDKIYLKPEYRMPDDDTPIANTVKEIRRIDDKYYRFDRSYIFIEDQDKYELVEQKPAEWSEEDREYMQSLLDIINGTPSLTPSEVECHKDWLKSLKDRVQPKQEWSVEDEKMIDAIYSCVDSNYDGLAKDALLIWLKSLRPQSNWKPNEREKEALLWCVVHLGGADKQTLGELLEELNKL